MKRELHPDLEADERAALVERGRLCFNAGRFFDAHEAWEEIWRSTSPEPRDLWRGLIQIAVGLYHQRVREKPGPARRVLARGLRRVETFPQGIEGLDLEALCREAGRWEAWLGDPERTDEPPLPHLERLGGER